MFRNRSTLWLYTIRLNLFVHYIYSLGNGCNVFWLVRTYHFLWQVYETCHRKNSPFSANWMTHWTSGHSFPVKKTVIECSSGSRPKTYYIRNRLLMSSHNLEKVDFAKHYFNKVWRSLKRSFFREWGNSTDRSDGSLNLVSFRDQGRMKTM